jgi:prepilin-type N-terminal cleavage/methylation domain-containing protein
MIRNRPYAQQSGCKGFTLLELVIAMAMFLVVSGAVFMLLENAQLKLMSEQNIVPVLQESRVGVDLMVRDIHRSGFPSPFEFSNTPDDPSTAPAALQNLFSVGFVGQPNQSCVVGGTCLVPNGFDLLMESVPDPANPNQQVQWIEYQLVRAAGQTSSTLMRRQVPKDVALGFAGAPATWIPILENILNDPNNPADAIFTYPCPGAVCPTANQLQQVQISLRVQSYRPDPRTGQYRQVSVVEVAQRMNPTP